MCFLYHTRFVLDCKTKTKKPSISILVSIFNFFKKFPKNMLKMVAIGMGILYNYIIEIDFLENQDKALV
ncbi:hypothetical protein CN619_21340 [Bacillus pseudomycoides]|nr:hypothetical protein CN619_21340 [Bacillus pseudomycoides]